MWRILLITVVLVGAGCEQPAPFPYPPTSTPYLTPTPVIGVLKSSKGVIVAKTYCQTSGQGMYTSCGTRFPNGEMIFDIPRDWSPDSRYAVACIGATHDSPCGWAEVWDMVKGKKIIEFSPAYCYVWSPTKPHLLGYLIESQAMGSNRAELYIIDVETNESLRQTTYPDWYKAKWAKLTVDTSCLARLDRIVGSEEHGFVGLPSH